jgi:hypothetical protein
MGAKEVTWATRSQNIIILIVLFFFGIESGVCYANDITKRDAEAVYSIASKWSNLRTDIVSVMAAIQRSGGDIDCIKSVHEEMHSISLAMALFQFQTSTASAMNMPMTSISRWS